MDEKPYREMVSWLKLIRAPGLSPAVIRQLLGKYSSPENIIAAEDVHLKALGLNNRAISYLRQPDQSAIELDLKWLDEANHYLIHLFHPYYPEILKQIPDPPVAMFAWGKPVYLSKMGIAIIGARKPSPGGRKIATEFARCLGKYGIIVTSGMAYGIDTAAHRGALDGGNGTIAVLGSGLDHIYPKSNLDLAEKIADNGLLISEFPLTVKPLPHHFPMRNRIISGISLGVLVVEAAEKSGSLITANLAAEQGREVFAVPGSILNPVAQGCNKLISNGAKLSTNIQDIVEELPGLQRLIIQHSNTLRTSQVVNETLDEQQKLLLDNIGYEPTSFDDIVTSSGISIEKLRILLPELELEDLIQTISGGRYVRK